MTITSAPRTATVGALLAVAAGLIAPNNLIAFYLTALAAAVLLFAAFLAYLDAAEQLDARSGLAVATAGLGAALVMADAAIRFPAVLDPHAPEGASALAVAALLVVIDRRGRRAGVDAGRLTPLRCASGYAPCGSCCTASRRSRRYLTQTGVPIGVLL